MRALRNNVLRISFLDTIEFHCEAFVIIVEKLLDFVNWSFDRGAML